MRQLTCALRISCVSVANAEVLNAALLQITDWYNIVRPHQHPGGRTPQEVWNGIDIHKCPLKAVRRFRAWDGLLVGEVLRR